MKMEHYLIGCVMAAICRIAIGAEQENRDQVIEEVIVVAHPLSGEGLAQPTAVLDGDELERKKSYNIGATLAQEPGIHIASFGTATSRPVIHGLSGPRVRIMEDRIDTLDVSVTSADHAISIEPFIAERIEVLKGSSTLLYGSGAIGGVVDVHTGRIPHELPDKPISGGIQTLFNDNNDGNTTSGKLNGKIGDFAWHLDGTWKDGNDYEIPGFAESRAQRLSEEEEHEEDVEARDNLPGSHHDFESTSVGASFIDDWGFVGLAVSQIDADYGIPGGHGHEQDEEGTPSIELEQTRVDFELGIRDPFAIFSSLNVRLGINDYEHQEIEPNSEIASDFSNEAWELRAELTYNSANWDGVLGFQHNDREFSVMGEEAFVPPVDSTDTGIFWVAERSFESFDLETGLRLGKVEHQPAIGSDTDFTTFSASLGFVIPLHNGWRIGLAGDVSSRAPVGEELYSNGAHLATNTFEIGDPNLDNEVALNTAVTFGYTKGPWDSAITVYYTQFRDLIFQQAAGEQMAGLPVFEYAQEDATFVGLDAEVARTIYEVDGRAVTIRALFDLVSAKLDISGNDNLPRLPPMKAGVGVTAVLNSFNLNFDYLYVDEQDDVTTNEFKTDSYNDLQVSLGWKMPIGRASIEWVLAGKNLLDDEQRHHSSFIKDLAPAPGRTIEAGLRLIF
jgi:iron complex outermembrane receptor protein